MVDLVDSHYAVLSDLLVVCVFTPEDVVVGFGSGVASWAFW
jgi:hypothetical protein